MDTYGILARITNTASIYHMDDFPGCDALGLDPDDARQKNVATFIARAISAGEMWQEQGDASYPYGYCEAMLECGVVSEVDINNALQKLFNHKTK